MGRPRTNTEAFGIRMEPGLHYELKVQASIEQMSSSALITKLVENYLKDRPLTREVTKVARKAMKKQ